MKRWFAIAAGWTLACSLACVAQEKGYWRAASSNADSITGDIAISDAKVTINLTTFPLAHIRKLEPGEIGAAFDADINSGISGSLYRLNISGAQKFLHHNSLCGSDDVQWMATYVLNKSLQVAFFSGTEMPVFKFEELQNSTNRCGTFSYAR
jgi:hypothetical protein